MKYSENEAKKVQHPKLLPTFCLRFSFPNGSYNTVLLLNFVIQLLNSVPPFSSKITLKPKPY